MTFQFCSETCKTSTLQIDAALDGFRAALLKGEDEGRARTDLTRETVKIFADPRRAFLISQTEGARAANGGQWLAAKASGIVTGKTWLATSDACDQCLEIDGKTVGLDDDFAYFEGRGVYSHVPFPPLHPGCMCSWTEEM